MKKFLIVLLLAFLFFTDTHAQQYEFKVITSVESIVPNGFGRSRLISANEDKDKKNKSDRSDIRVANYEETKLLNFYNLGGIRFQNIAANDVVITSKLNDLSKQGWELVFVTSAVESFAGKEDTNGIFITRYTFKRALQENNEE